MNNVFSQNIKLTGSDLEYTLISETLDVITRIEENKEFKYGIGEDQYYTYKEYNKDWVYYCTETNNKLIIRYSLLEDEYNEVKNNLDVSDVINSIMEKPFNYMNNELINNKNINIFISKIYGTTPDYVIYYGEYNGNDFIYGSEYKYTKTKDGKSFDKILFE